MWRLYAITAGIILASFSILFWLTIDEGRNYTLFDAIFFSSTGIGLIILALYKRRTSAGKLEGDVSA